MKAAILVNGVPACGKSTVAKSVSQRLGVPLMTLDTVKQPMFEHLGVGDREYNRKLGRASYEIIFSAIGEWPDPTVVVVDAWFGFQPSDVLERHLATAGITETAELWCHAPPAVIGERYASRVGSRSVGHPGPEYVAELVALAERAKPLDRGPRLDVDTTRELRLHDVVKWLGSTLVDLGRHVAMTTASRAVSE